MQLPQSSTPTSQSLIRRMEKVQEQRDVENKAAIADVSRRADKLKQENKELRALISDIQTRLGKAEAEVPDIPGISTTDWSRKPDRRKRVVRFP